MLLKLENPVGHRIQQLTVQGDMLGDEQAVDVAFLGEQAVPPTVGRNRRAVGVDAVQGLEVHVRARQTVSPALTAMKIQKEDLLAVAGTVDSGVAEVVRLQEDGRTSSRARSSGSDVGRHGV